MLLLTELIVAQAIIATRNAHITMQSFYIMPMQAFQASIESSTIAYDQSPYQSILVMVPDYTSGQVTSLQLTTYPAVDEDPASYAT